MLVLSMSVAARHARTSHRGATAKRARSHPTCRVAISRRPARRVYAFKNKNQSRDDLLFDWSPLLLGLSSCRGHGHGQGRGCCPRQSFRSLLQLQLRTTVRTSWSLRVNARRSGSILVNASRAAGIFYYVAHIDYTQYIGGLKPICIEEGVIFICLQLQQLLAGYKPRHHRRDKHHLWYEYDEQRPVAAGCEATAP
jgi:hypothetical protein